MASSVIECTALTKKFGDFTAVNSLDLTVPQGTVFGYLGPNGAGKSTTIRMVMGVARPTGGSVRLLGADPAAPSATTTRARVGYLPGELRLDDRLTVAQQLDHWAAYRGSVDRKHRDALSERLGLRPDRAVRTLSTGNRRKVGLVGAFMSRPELLVLDEPTNGLDPLVQQQFLAMVEEARDAGATVLLSSHILSEVERVAERIAVLRGGELVLQGTVAEIQSRARQQLTATFPGPPPVEELRALPEAQDVTVDETGVRLTLSGPAHPVLEVLARHRAESVVAPKREIEDIFLTLYGDNAGGTQHDAQVEGEQA
ncbi:ABC transporter ATP-binding protein [Streptomyces spiramenti]|uniref:ABC transporter ATP-binding protein n=1 Tax=Streptomyces spiramenti TaxID=2720606 RepID=A0ABX1APQ0_9ACTN|nr:ABC transporter ATP-binding protein [Streptomyces spiramenti]NJP67611.1 ABC transporter ATP-binding protein [Streptomyces spiramenti]